MTCSAGLAALSVGSDRLWTLSAPAFSSQVSITSYVSAQSDTSASIFNLSPLNVQENRSLLPQPPSRPLGQSQEKRLFNTSQELKAERRHLASIRFCLPAYFLHTSVPPTNPTRHLALRPGKQVGQDVLLSRSPVDNQGSCSLLSSRTARLWITKGTVVYCRLGPLASG
jgi:hypothetical protein